MSRADGLIASLRAAVAAAPDDVPLRLHLAELLLAEGAVGDAVREAAHVLTVDPASAAALELIAGARDGARGSADAKPDPGDTGPEPQPEPEDDLARLDAEFDGVVPRQFLDDAPARPVPPENVVRMADVGGMQNVKDRLEAALFAPMRNPELRALYRKSLTGGLLLYGPPGCGKTYIARAVAGEFGADFFPVTLTDVLDMYLGASERNLHEIFERARRHQPAVLFFDEIDAIGQKRSQRQGSAGRSTVNQLLEELDGVHAVDDGVFVIGATNHPWDVDAALKRPGRFDRSLFVGPPDRAARATILRNNLTGRPVGGIDLGALAESTDGLSGADLTHLCVTAAERALIDSARTGRPRLITMADLTSARAEIRPSLGAWYDTARNVVRFANASGEYDELAAFMKATRRL